MEKLRQQEEQRIQMQRHLEQQQQHSADQPEHEMAAGDHRCVPSSTLMETAFCHCLAIGC